MPFLSPIARATAWPSVMPMSSTVWCASMCRSLLRLDLRSTGRGERPGRACGRGTARRWPASAGRCRQRDADPDSGLGGVAGDFGGTHGDPAVLWRRDRRAAGVHKDWRSASTSGRFSSGSRPSGEGSCAAIRAFYRRPDQDTAGAQPLEGRRAVGHAHQQEIGARREHRRAGRRRATPPASGRARPGRCADAPPAPRTRPGGRGAKRARPRSAR